MERSKSCLVAKTQKESLRKTPRRSLRRRRISQKKSLTELKSSFLGQNTDEDGLNRTGRDQLLTSTHQQKNFRASAGKLDVEEDIATEHGACRALRFFDVEVREYEVTASDNPGVRSGVAIEVSIHNTSSLKLFSTTLVVFPILPSPCLEYHSSGGSTTCASACTSTASRTRGPPSAARTS